MTKHKYDTAILQMELKTTLVIYELHTPGPWKKVFQRVLKDQIIAIRLFHIFRKPVYSTVKIATNSGFKV